MMHHPNMHHQQMSGHPPQHLGGHQGMPAHHQMPPHQMHRENRMAMGPSQQSGALGGMPGMSVPHLAPAQRPPHPIRAMHHPPGPHHGPPPPVHTNQGGMKTMRRAFVGNNCYGGGNVVTYPQTTRVHPPPAVPSLCRPSSPPMNTTSCTTTRNFGPLPNLRRPPSPPMLTTSSTATRDYGVSAQSAAPPPASPPAASESDAGALPDAELAPHVANSKEKTPMCLVNELARYNKIKHQYRLTSETGPAHKKVFTVTLRLGDTEEYTAEGSSIKRAQHAAAGAALTKTSFPAPPPRHPPAHDTSHHRHAGAVMPTVELNALAMKLCLPVEYSALPPAPRTRPPAHYRMPYLQSYNQRMMSPSLTYRVRVSVGGQVWLGEGSTPQAARHDAAARALHDLRPANAAQLSPGATPNHADTSSEGADFITSEVKSPVSMVHELALKKNLGVVFSVKSERGPPHMRVFVTACTVGNLETEGEGNGKKVSKRRAAQLMLDEMRRCWPPALLRARPPPAAKRKSAPGKRKSRNLIKASPESTESTTSDNPISRLAQDRHSARAASPCYRVLEERGLARRREFVVLCDAPPHAATGQGPNKKTAKRRAAHNVLMAMELGPGEMPPLNGEHVDSRTSANANDLSGEENRQPLPGVLLMDNNYHHHQLSTNHSVPPTSTSSPPGSTSGTGAIDQLMYLSQLMGFTVEFSDFPKRNRGSYLSLVSLSTKPPVMCHGGGTSTATSHENCARNALGALAKMGLDTPDRVQNSGAIPPALTNGVPE